jgi:hypothetical protein
MKTYLLGEELPQVMTRRQLAAFMQISLDRLDEYRRLKNHPAVRELEGPGHPRFDARAAKAWRDGGSYAPVARRPLRKVG